MPFICLGFFLVADIFLYFQGQTSLSGVFHVLLFLLWFVVLWSFQFLRWHFLRKNSGLLPFELSNFSLLILSHLLFVFILEALLHLTDIQIADTSLLMLFLSNVVPFIPFVYWNKTI